jgi:hypothetical protein
VPIYSAPQLGLDYILGPGITVGGSLGYLHRGSSRETTTGAMTTSRDLPSGHAILFHPRVGFALPLTPLFGLWLRGGVTYFTASSEQTNVMGTVITNVTVNGFALTLDPNLVITPLPHFGVTVGPMLDLPLAGTLTAEQRQGAMSTSTDTSVKVTNYGLAAGLLVYF